MIVSCPQRQNNYWSIEWTSNITSNNETIPNSLLRCRIPKNNENRSLLLDAVAQYESNNIIATNATTTTTNDTTNVTTTSTNNTASASPSVSTRVIQYSCHSVVERLRLLDVTFRSLMTFRSKYHQN
mmetsp:Transcript_14637/g.17817  ORF Transcript_14637/g.17817 Transcript_14637/m.17817 type:complete len:127 (+) Transcript_14637:690-1070(+)